MFAVEYAASGWQVRNQATGLLAACRIPTYDQAKYQAEYFSTRPKRAKGFSTWHSKQRSKGPTTVQRERYRVDRKPLGWERPNRKYASDRSDASGLPVVRKGK